MGSQREGSGMTVIYFILYYITNNTLEGIAWRLMRLFQLEALEITSALQSINEK